MINKFFYDNIFLRRVNLFDLTLSDRGIEEAARLSGRQFFPVTETRRRDEYTQFMIRASVQNLLKGVYHEGTLFRFRGHSRKHDYREHQRMKKIGSRRQYRSSVPRPMGDEA